MYIDTSFERCEANRSYVLLDQAQEQCAEEHQYGMQNCPLKRFFSGAYSIKSEIWCYKEVKNFS